MKAFVEIAYRGLTIKCEPVYGANSEHTFFQQFKSIFNWTLSLKSFLLTLYIMVALVQKYQYGNEIDALGLLPKDISGWVTFISNFLSTEDPKKILLKHLITKSFVEILAFYCLRIGNCFVPQQFVCFTNITSESKVHC